jgi:hypothetical protein
VRVIEAVNITTDLDPFLSLKGLAGYSGMSVRKLRDCLTRPVSPLPYYRVDGKILVRRSDFDSWMDAFKHTPDLDRLVDKVVADLRR